MRGHIALSGFLTRHRDYLEKVAAGRKQTSLEQFGYQAGQDATNAFRDLFKANPAGCMVVLPPGAIKVRLQSLVVPGGTILSASRPGRTEIVGVRGQTAPGAHKNAIFSVGQVSDVGFLGLNFAGPNSAFTAISVRGTENIEVSDCAADQICLIWSYNSGLSYAEASPDKLTKNLKIIRCKGLSTTQVLPFIQIKFVKGAILQSCSSKGYLHGIEFWGGDANRDGNPANPRKCTDVTIDSCQATNALLGGIWGAMGSNVVIRRSYAARCGDVGIDFEGCQNSSVEDCTAEDCRNANFAVFFRNTAVRFERINSISSDASRYPFLFKSWNATGRTRENQDVVIRSSTFECRNGIGLITNDAGAASPFIFEKNKLFSARIDLAYFGPGGTGKQSVIGNVLSFRNPHLPELFGQATGGSSRSLIDLGRAGPRAWSVNQHKNSRITIVGGRGTGQSRQIDGNSGNTLKVSPAWGVPPDHTSVYRIEIAAITVGGSTGAEQIVRDNTVEAIQSPHYLRAIHVRGEEYNASPRYTIDSNTLSGFPIAGHVEHRGMNAGQRTVAVITSNRVAKGATWTVDYAQSRNGTQRPSVSNVTTVDIRY